MKNTISMLYDWRKINELMRELIPSELSAPIVWNALNIHAFIQCLKFKVELIGVINNKVSKL